MAISHPAGVVVSALPVQLASPQRRLAAAVADACLNMVVLIVVSVLFDPSIPDRVQLARMTGLERSITANVLAWVSTLVAMIPHAILIATRGQSVAKIVFGLRIVTADGSPAGFYRGFVLRYLPFTLLSLTPSFLGALQASSLWTSRVAALSLIAHAIDGAMIFGKRRRCLHDWIAGTLVARLPSEPSAVPPS